MKSPNAISTPEVKPNYVSKAVEQAVTEGLIDPALSIPDKLVKLPTVEQFKAWEQLYASEDDRVRTPGNAEEEGKRIALKKGVAAGRLVSAVAEVMQSRLFELSDKGQLEYSGNLHSESHHEAHYEPYLPRPLRHVPEYHTWTDETVTIRYKDDLVGLTITTLEENAYSLKGSRQVEPPTVEQVVIDLNAQEVYFTHKREENLQYTAADVGKLIDVDDYSRAVML